MPCNKLRVKRQYISFLVTKQLAVGKVCQINFFANNTYSFVYKTILYHKHDVKHIVSSSLFCCSWDVWKRAPARVPISGLIWRCYQESNSRTRLPVRISPYKEVYFTGPKLKSGPLPAQNHLETAVIIVRRSHD